MADVEKRRIAILGSTGSIGTQALDVIRVLDESLEVTVLTAHNNYELLIAQAREFKPDSVVICNEAHYAIVKEALQDELIKVYAGYDAVGQVVQFDNVDVVLTAMVGFAGLKSTIKAVEAGKLIALANKETLVVAGEYITDLIRVNKSAIVPVDSEHSALFQCLAGEQNNPVEKLILTASGGPFRGYSYDDLLKVTKAQALNHPNWNMGNKITIDSATMMNKGLEVIEAHWLFGVSPGNIEVVVHPQSIIHSMVQFRDGSLKAQMGLPDMRLPIQYALCYPYRLVNNFPRLDFSQLKELTFQQADFKTFRNLELAFDVLTHGGNMPCVLNAANEVAVEAFLQEQISFTQITSVIEKCLEKVSFIKKPCLEDYFETDNETRNFAKSLTGNK